MEQVNERIQAYINNQLEGTELAEFEDMIKKDKKLAAEVDFAFKMKHVFEHKDTFRLSALIREIQEENPVEPNFDYVDDNYLASEEKAPELVKSPTDNMPKTIQYFNPKWLIGLVASGLIVVFIIWLNIQNQTKENIIFIKNQLNDSISYYQSIISDNPADSLLKIGMQYYKNDKKDFKQAAEVLNKYLSDEQNQTARTPAHLYLGISQNFEGQYDAAIYNLNIVINDPDRKMLHDIAIWHLGLAYYAKGEKKEAKNTLEKLRDNEQFRTAVLKVLERLNE